MFLFEWRQEILQKHLAHFSAEELQTLHDLSAVPSVPSDVYTLCLSEENIAYLGSFYCRETPYIPGKLPDALTDLCIQVDIPAGKTQYYFKRLESHHAWYVLDVFQQGHYQCTFLAMDSEPIPELRVSFAPFYIPVCILTNKQDELSNTDAFQAFKFAHYLFHHQTANRQ